MILMELLKVLPVDISNIFGIYAFFSGQANVFVWR